MACTNQQEGKVWRNHRYERWHLVSEAFPLRPNIHRTYTFLSAGIISFVKISTLYAISTPDTGKSLSQFLLGFKVLTC
jgi:hypothetical protein